MGLFDNIFLDQNSPTAMLDPLLTDEQKQEQEEAKKKQKEASVAEVAEVSLEASPEASAVDAISFDDVTAESTVINSTSPGGFLASPSTPAEEVSFDIGGFDLPAFDDATTTTTDDANTSPSFLAGGTAAPASETSMTSDVTLTDATDSSSIALVQGATSATSDAIIDIGATGVVEPSSGDAGTIQITEEPSTLVSIGASEEATSGLLTITSEEPQGDNSLFGMFSTTDEADKKDETITIQDTVASTESTDTILSGVSLPSSVEATPIVDTLTATATAEMINFDTVTPLVSLVTSSSDTEVLVDTIGSTARFSPDSPLHEMLSEFVSRLEKFNSESATLDTEMVASETALAKEQTDLQLEYETRLRAIEYKRKHMEQTRRERKDEKTRLERIISNLKKEIV